MTGHLVEGKNSVLGDFPGGPVVKNPPSNIRDVKSIPDRGTKIPHATGQLSQWATTSEPELWSLQVATIKPTLHDY